MPSFKPAIDAERRQLMQAQAIDSAAPLHGDWKQLPILNEQHGIHINARTAATRWGGEKMDYDIGIGALLRQRARGQRVSVETSG